LRRFLFLAVLIPLPVLAGTISISKGLGTVTTGKGNGRVDYAFAVPPSTAPACVGTFANATFTEAGTGNLNLSASIPESGGIWSGANSTDGTLVVDRSVDEVKSTNGTGLTKVSYLSLSADCTNYSVFASAKAGSTTNSNRVGIMGRYDGATDTGYRFRIEGDGTARLEKLVNGTNTDLDTDPIAGFSVTTYYSLELRMSGTTISGWVNGVQECLATDASITTPGTIGMIIRNGNARLTSISAAYP
jgi:hypothetical protein